LVKDKSHKKQNLEMLRPGIPEKAIKSLSIRNKRDPKKITKTRPNQEDGRSHHEPTHYVHRYLAV
jgi:hypothetical protein